MAAFPTLPSGYKPDSQKFVETVKDQAIRSSSEGGYVYSRPRYTRPAPKMWDVAYQQLTNADKTAIDNHVSTQKGGSLIFDWLNPQSGVTYSVRYTELPTWEYVGRGNLQRWNCRFRLEQA